jgi:ribosome-interacting GTPase 1
VLSAVTREVAAAGIESSAALVVTKTDDAQERDVERIRAAFPSVEVVAVSILDDASLDRLRDLIWRLTGLVRVYLRGDDDPVALHPPVTVADVAHSIHHELGASCRGAHVWGPSARFPGQRVGPQHLLADGDAVEIVS